jgi:hypothetical protein
VVILQAEVETGKDNTKIVRVRTSEGWMTYKKSSLQLVSSGSGVIEESDGGAGGGEGSEGGD